jgi:hypothetical protein
MAENEEQEPLRPCHWERTTNRKLNDRVRRPISEQPDDDRVEANLSELGDWISWKGPKKTEVTRETGIDSGADKD